jgi:hypothetical protein
VLSLGAFVVAGGLAIVTNLPQGYQVFGQSSLERMVERRFWDGDAATAAWRVTQLRVQIIKQARVNNRAKARRLRQVWVINEGRGF